MLAIFGTSHKSNVLLANFLVYVSAPTLLIMDFTILGQIVACAMRLTSACMFSHNKSLNGETIGLYVLQWKHGMPLACGELLYKNAAWNKLQVGPQLSICDSEILACK